MAKTKGAKRKVGRILAKRSAAKAPVALDPAATRRYRVGAAIMGHIAATARPGMSVVIPYGLSPRGAGAPITAAEVKHFVSEKLGGQVSSLHFGETSCSFRLNSATRPSPVRVQALTSALPKGPPPPTPLETMALVLEAAVSGAASHKAVRSWIAAKKGVEVSVMFADCGGDSWDRRISACIQAHLSARRLSREGAVIAVTEAGRVRHAAGHAFSADELPKLYRLPPGRTPVFPSAGTKTVSVNIGRILADIPKAKPDRLLGYWHNALRVLADPDYSRSFPTARRICEAVEAAWSKIRPEDDEYFAWPDTDAPKRGKTTVGASFQDEGMLSYLEYRVGKTAGLSSPVRHSILSRVFEGKLPRVFSKSYMDQWGDPGTALRLRKMAECIAAFARNNKRKDDDRLDEAIRNWEQDLAFLYDRYYVGRFGFGWPTTATEQTRMPGRH